MAQASTTMSDTTDENETVVPRYLSPKNAAVVGVAALAGGAFGGLPGVFAAAALVAGGRMIGHYFKYRMGSGEPFVYNQGDGALLLGVVSAVGGVAGLWGTAGSVMDRNNNFVNAATDRAITHVVEGEKSAFETAGAGPKLFGRYDVFGRTEVTAEQIGTDGVCSSVRVVQGGEKPYIVAVRPPDTKGGQYQPCTPD